MGKHQYNEDSIQSSHLQAASYGVEADLVRVSVGVEDTVIICEKFKRALQVLEEERQNQDPQAKLSIAEN